jgi:N-acetylneuraminic acid mutarotase
MTPRPFSHPAWPLVVGAAIALLAGCSPNVGTSVPAQSGASDALASGVLVARAHDVPLKLAHNAWAALRAMPTGALAAGAGAVGTKIYVLGGVNATGVLGLNQIYDTASDSWSSGAPMPTPRWAFATAVVNGLVYAIGGQSAGGAQTHVVEADDPATDSWSSGAPMPTSRDSLAAAVANGDVYAIGGYAGKRLATVEKYDPVANSWTTAASLTVAKSSPGVGTIKTSIFAASGLAQSGGSLDNEVFGVKKGVWKKKPAAPLVQNAACYAIVKKHLYMAGGADANGTQQNALVSYDPKPLKSALADMPQAQIGAAGATANGLLYCFGGANAGFPFQSGVTFYSNVQVYTP